MRIEHIALYVNNLEKARDFFVKYFTAVSNEGYYNPRTDFRSYFLTFGDGSRLELMTKPDLTDSGDFLNRFGYAHIAFSVGSKEAVDSLTETLKADGYPTISGPRTTGDGYYESCILGFEGNLIEITV
ncbi:MAG: VOC family protein [Oscillospiraceae bacterium]|nr:VOC family protein [Oscillospiraceae bacterium]